jgi:hypothetical protein
MAKNWVTKFSNAMEFGDTRTREEKRAAGVQKSRAFNRLMKSTISRSYEKMVEASDVDYENRCVYERNLLEAFNNKKLKSKNLIKQAQTLRKRNAEDKKNEDVAVTV